MTAAALALALALPAAAAQSGSKRPDLDDKTLFTPSPAPWLKVYVLQPYGEFWSLSVELKNMEKDLPRLRQALEKAGGALTVPIQNLAASPESRQLQMSWRLPKKGGKGLLKAIRRFAKAADPVVRPPFEPIPLPEVRAKLDALSAERERNREAFGRMPAALGLVEETLDHLRLAHDVGEKARELILLNVAVREAPRP